MSNLLKGTNSYRNNDELLLEEPQHRSIEQLNRKIQLSDTQTEFQRQPSNNSVKSSTRGNHNNGTLSRSRKHSRAKIVRASSVQKVRQWRQEIEEGDRIKMRAILEKIRPFRDLQDPGIKEEFCAIFNKEQVAKVIALDLQKGYDLNDIQDCLDALNELPKLDRRMIFKRIKDRISVFPPYLTRKASLIYEKKTGNVDIFSSSSSLPDFQNCDEDFELLKYCYIDRHHQDYYGDYNKLEVLQTIVKQFCPETVSEIDPQRIVKLLEILDNRHQALQLLVKLPPYTLISENATKRCPLQPREINLLNELRDCPSNLSEEQLVEQFMSSQDPADSIALLQADIDENYGDIVMQDDDQFENQSLTVEDLTKRFLLRKKTVSSEHVPIKNKVRKENKVAADLKNERLGKVQEQPKTIDNMRETLLTELEEKHAQQVRKIDVKNYGDFLQCIPVPFVHNSQKKSGFKFLTLQGKARDFDGATGAGRHQQDDLNDSVEQQNPLIQQQSEDSDEEEKSIAVKVQVQEQQTVDKEKETLKQWAKESSRWVYDVKQVIYKHESDSYINELKMTLNDQRNQGLMKEVNLQNVLIFEDYIKPLATKAKKYNFDLEKLFDKYNESKNGKLSVEEFKNMLSDYLISVSDEDTQVLNQHFKKHLKADHMTKVDFAEQLNTQFDKKVDKSVAKHSLQQIKIKAEQLKMDNLSLKEAIESFNHQKTEMINIVGFKKAINNLKCLDQRAIDNLAKYNDINNEGYISIYNFITMIKNTQISEPQQQNDQRKALLALWTYNSENDEFSCEKSIEINEPIPFKDKNYYLQTSCQLTYLYRSQSNEIFWFSSQREDKKGPFILNRWNDQDNVHPVVTKPINPRSRLHQYLELDDQRLIEVQSYENPLPTMLYDKRHKSRMIVFTANQNQGEQKKQAKPIVYFYDMDIRREIAQVAGASIFFQYESSTDSYNANDQVCMLNQKAADKASFLFDSKDIDDLIAPDAANQEGLDNPTQSMPSQPMSLNRDKSVINETSSSAKKKGIKTVWFSCNIDFTELKKRAEEGYDMKELCGQEAIEQYKGLKTKYSNNESLNQQSSSNESCQFKVIESYINEIQNTSASVKVLPSKKVDGTTSCILINNAFEEKCQGLRILDVTDSQAKINITSIPLKQYFKAETKSDNGSSSLIEISTQSNGNKLLHYSQYDYALTKKGGKDNIIKVEREIITLEDDQIQFQQPMITDQNMLLISSINEKDGALIWYSISLTDENQSKQSTVSNQLQFQIDYPIISHLQQDHLNNQLIVTNLAYPDQQKCIFEFDQIKFIAYINLSKIHTESRICFLAKSFSKQYNKSKKVHEVKENLCIVLMKHDKSFEYPKSDDQYDLENWQILKFNLQGFADMQANLAMLKKAYLVQYDCYDSAILNENVQPAILLVTSESIYFTEYTRCQDVRKLAAGAKNSNDLVNLGLTRGYNNCFFYVEKSSETYIVCELLIGFRVKERQWTWKTTQIFNSSYGKIIAMDLDQTYDKKNDSFWNSEDQLDFGQKVKNSLFLIDSASNLLKLKQSAVESQYQVVFKINLGHIQELTPHLEWLSTCNEPKISISDRSLTIRGYHFVYETGHSSLIKFRNSDQCSVISSQSVEFTNLQLHQLQKNLKNGQSKLQIIIKESPNSRKCCFIGQKCQRDVKLCCFITEDKLLLKIRTERQNEFYWSFVDSHGQVHEIKEKLRNILYSQNWTHMNSQAIRQAQTLVMLKSEEYVAGLRFNQNGDLIQDSIHRSTFDEVDLVAENLQCSYSGDLYLLALVSKEPKTEKITDPSIFDEVCGNGHNLKKYFGCPYPGGGIACDRCRRITYDSYELNQGFMRCSQCDYDVCQKCIQIEITVQIERKRMNKENPFQFKIFCQQHKSNNSTLSSILLDPKHDTRSENDHLTHLIICGDYLCWRDPSEWEITLTNIHDLTDLIKFGHAELYESQLIYKKIDLYGLLHGKQLSLKQNDMSSITMKACTPLYALHGYTDCEFNEEDIIKRNNTLQVTIQSRAILYDLSKDAPIEAIAEVPAMHHLLNCQSYVETGISINKIKVKKLQQNGKTLMQEQEIKQNSKGNYYYLTTKANQAQTSNVFQGGYQTYSELDLIEIRRLQDLLNSNKVVKKIDLQTVYSVFEGQSIFTLFEGYLRLYNQIQSQLVERDFQSIEDFDGEEIESPFLRRIVQILSQKTETRTKQHGDKTMTICTSILQRNQREVHVRDTLLQIANMCPNFCLFDTLSDQTSMEKILKNASPTIIELLNSCFVETKTTRQIRRVKWSQSIKGNTFNFFQTNYMVTDMDCENQINSKGKNDNLIINQVKVQKFNVSWMFKKNQTYLDLVRILNNSCGESHNGYSEIYATEFVSVLIKQFWVMYQKRLFWGMFIPFIFYLVFSIMFIYIVLYNSVYYYMPYDSWLLYGSAIISAVFWLFQVYLEILQRTNSYVKCSEVVCNPCSNTNFWDRNDLIHLIIVFIMQVVNLTGLEKMGLDAASILAAIGVFSLIIKFYEWLRIFEMPSFYIYLIGQTMTEIQAFIVLYITSLLLFGFPLLMLNFNSYEDSAVYETLSGFSLADALMNQYYLGLGEFHTENFKKHPHSVMIFLVFVAATLYTQITMLNMLIAIMSDTFEKVTENSAGIKRQIRLSMMEEYTGLLKFVTHKNQIFQKKTQPDNIFLYRITVDQEEFEDFESWEGSINHIKKINERHFNGIKQNYKKQMEKLIVLEEKVNELATRDVSKQIYSSQSKITARIDNFEANFVDKFRNFQQNTAGTPNAVTAGMSTASQEPQTPKFVENSGRRRKSAMEGVFSARENADNLAQSVIKQKLAIQQKNQEEDIANEEEETHLKLENQLSIKKMPTALLDMANFASEDKPASAASMRDEIQSQQDSDKQIEEDDEQNGEQKHEPANAEMFEMFNQTTKTVQDKVVDLAYKVDNSMQLNSALDFNLQQLSQKVDELSITMDEKIAKQDSKMSEISTSLQKILTKLEEK